MRLEQFKEIADENLKDLNVDERMVQRIHQRLCTDKAPRSRPRVPRGAYVLAAACLVVMIISGGVLMRTLPQSAARASDAQDGPGTSAMQLLPEASAASTLSSSLSTSQFIDGSTLSYGIAQVGAFNEGYAPAMATNGLYGYVNESGVWVVRAMYDEADEVFDGKATVVVQGATQIIEIP